MYSHVGYTEEWPSRWLAKQSTVVDPGFFEGGGGGSW